MRNTFAQTITQLAQTNDKIVLLSGDIGNRLFDELKSRTTKRFFNCGVAEANMMSVASGLALNGFRPFVYTITPFTTIRCLEQIKIGAAYHNAPLTIVGTGSGLSYASLGPTHHSLEDISSIKAIPNIDIYAPWDPPSLKMVLYQVLSKKKPAYIRIGKKGEEVIKLTEINGIDNEGHCVKPGTSCCIIAFGTIVDNAISAAKKLESSGVSVAVYVSSKIKPLPTKLISHLATTYRNIVSVEEHSKIGGIGESVGSYLSNKYPSCNFHAIGTHDFFLSKIGTKHYAREQLGIGIDSIVNHTNNMLKI